MKDNLAQREKDEAEKDATSRRHYRDLENTLRTDNAKTVTENERLAIKIRDLLAQNEDLQSIMMMNFKVEKMTMKTMRERREKEKKEESTSVKAPVMRKARGFIPETTSHSEATAARSK